MNNKLLVTIGKGCPICPQAIEAVDMLNPQLPLNEQIQIINTDSEDPSIKNIMEEYFGSEESNWSVPLLKLELKDNRIFIFSASFASHYYNVIRNLFKLYRII